MPKAGKTGRTGAVDEARELLALLATLDDEGDRIEAEAIAKRLGCDVERAKKLIYLVGSAYTDNWIPSFYTDDDEQDLVLGNATTGARGYGLRLSASETRAVLAALEKLGTRAGDPLREKLAASVLSADAQVDGETLRRSLGGEKDVAVTEYVQTCSEAIHRKKALRFWYAKVNDDAASAAERLAVPRSITCEEGLWYLDCYDTGRRATRRFRIDRMSRLTCEDVPAGAVHEAQAAAAAGERPRRQTMVRLTFSDAAFIEKYLWWPDIKILTIEDGHGEAEIPYLENSAWLPRQIAACGGSVTTNNEQVNRLARDYAAAQLEV